MALSDTSPCPRPPLSVDPALWFIDMHSYLEILWHFVQDGATAMTLGIVSAILHINCLGSPGNSLYTWIQVQVVYLGGDTWEHSREVRQRTGGANNRHDTQHASPGDNLCPLGARGDSVGCASVPSQARDREAKYLITASERH